MKLQILQDDLNKGLTMVTRVAATRGQLPILANVLIQAEKDGVQLSATNLEIGLRARIGGKVIEPGAITIPARNLSEFVGSLGSGTLDLTTEAETLKVASATSSATFTGIAASEFPVIPQISDDAVNKAAFTREDISSIATQIAYASAGDESRPVLTGIQFKPVTDGIQVVATDGFRMSRKIIPSAKLKIQDSIILPSRTILELAKLVESSKKDEVQMSILPEGNQVLFVIDQIELVSRILEGNFPDVTKIIPSDPGTIVYIDRQEWLKTLRTAGIFARENSNIVRFKLADGKMHSTAAASSVGENASDMEVELKGDGGEISFNWKFISDFLASITTERVLFKMDSSTAPGIFMAEGDDSLLHIIMPVRIQS